jgi:tyrosinase
MSKPRVSGGALRGAALLSVLFSLAALLATTPAQQRPRPATSPLLRFQANPSTKPVQRESLAEFIKDPKKLAALRRGVKKMRELDSKDPRSWVFQANIHWRPFFPVYVWQQAQKSTDPAQQLFRDDPGFTPDPNVFNQCPHGNWWFLPWHRAYLYYFERILRWAAEDPTLTLPYWDYSDPDQRELPRVLRDAKLGDEDNSLYLPESATFTDDAGQAQVFLMRDGPLLRGETQLTAAVTSLKALTVIPFTTVKPLPAGQGFGSPAACDLMCGCGSGAVEAVPHNRVHTAVGGSSAMAGGSVRIGFMGTIETAARDPVFWLHHCNIDRLWASWDALGEGRRIPDDPAWLGQEFVFFDVDMTTKPPGQPKPVRVTVEQLRTTEQLGYRYDRLAQPPATVAAAPAPPAALPLRPTLRPLASARTPKAEPGAPHGVAPDAQGIQLSTAKPKVVRLDLGDKVAPGQLRGLLAPKPAAGAGQVVLSLEGIRFAHPPGVDYEVYLNPPAKATLTPESPYFVGTLTFFGMRHPGAPQGHGARASAHYVKFALPPALRQALSGKDEVLKELRLTFVPQAGTEPARKAGARPAPPPDRPAVTIRHIRLLEVR